MHYVSANNLKDSKTYKDAFKHYKTAIKIFEDIKNDTKSLKLPEIGIDFSETSLSLNINSAKAHAHFCVLETLKQQSSSPNPWTLAKLCKRTAELFLIANKTNPLPLTPDIAKKPTYDNKRDNWSCLAKMFYAISYYYAACSYSQENVSYKLGDWGMANGYINESYKTFEEAKKIFSTLDGDDKTYFKNFYDLIKPKKEYIETKNKTVYKEPLPTSLVNIEIMEAPNTETFKDKKWDEGFEGKDVLSHLVSQVYRELENEYKSLLHKTIKSEEEMEKQYEIEEDKFKKDHNIFAFEAKIQKTDDEFPQRIEDLIKRFHKKRDKNKVDIYRKECKGHVGTCDYLTGYVQEELKKEEKQDEKYRTHYGAKWNRKTSAELNKGMKEKLEFYKTEIRKEEGLFKELQNKLDTPQAKEQLELVSKELIELKFMIPRNIEQANPQSTPEFAQYIL